MLFMTTPTLRDVHRLPPNRYCWINIGGIPLIPSIVAEVTDSSKALPNTFSTDTEKSDGHSSDASLLPMTLGIDPTTIDQSE